MTTQHEQNGSRRDFHPVNGPPGTRTPIGPGPAEVSQPANRHLESIERKLQLVRDYTTSVALGYAPGLFVWGGGIGKSYTVVRQLDALEANHKTLNSRVTGWGLICHLEQFPSQVTLIEDAESMYRDPRAIGVLRSALDCQRREGDEGPVERWVTWAGDGSARKAKRVLFSGGIIVLSNSELPPRPEVQALKTRIACVHLTATDEEIRALMRFVSARGYTLNGRTMTPTECAAVCAFVEHEMHMLQSPPSMRLLINGFAAYLQWAAGQSGTHWHDMIRAEIREQAPPVFKHAVAIRKPPSRAERIAEHQQVVREILAHTADRKQRLELWTERTGLAHTAFYARKAEVEAQE